MKKSFILLVSVFVSVVLSSLDRAYTVACKKDQLKGEQATGQYGGDNDAGKLYGVHSIPDNFLLIP